MLEIGTKVNNFTLLDQYGNKHSLDDYKGKKVVIYFYPKDNTPGCSLEAQMYKEDYSKFKENNIVVLGISKDSVESHLNFCNKYQLPFTLLSDQNLKVIKYFNAYGKKKMFNNEYYGIIRKTYVLNENHEIIKIYEKATPKTNSKEILKFLNIE